MAIKNYTTSIKIEKTIMEIENILAKFGAKSIYKVYNDNQIPIGIAFQILVNDNPLSFKLPMNEDNILMVFKNQCRKGNLPKRYWNDIDQARRTGWRILKDWIDSQMALIEIEIAKPEEIFLPYMYDMSKNETLFQKLESKNFQLLLE